MPKEAFCIRVFDFLDFALSPFAHYETIPKEAMEDWARAFNQVATDLDGVVEADEDPGRTRNIGIAA